METQTSTSIPFVTTSSPPHKVKQQKIMKNPQRAPLANLTNIRKDTFPQPLPKSQKLPKIDENKPITKIDPSPTPPPPQSSQLKPLPLPLTQQRKNLKNFSEAVGVMKGFKNFCVFPFF